MNTRMIVSAVVVSLCSFGLFSANSLARDKVTADEARNIAKEKVGDIFCSSRFPLCWCSIAEHGARLSVGQHVHLSRSQPALTLESY